jgi:hypothetical protein
MAFLYRRGKGARRRVMHLAHYDGHGRIDGSWCGFTEYDTSINLPLGLRTCRNCLRRAQP